MVEESRGTAAAPIAVSTALNGGGLGPDTGGTLGAVSEERKDERCLLIVCGIVHNVHAAIIQEIWQVVEESRGRKPRRLPRLQRPRAGRAGGNIGTPH